MCIRDRAYTVPNASGLYDYTLFVYKNDGTLAFSREIDFQYRYMDIDGDNLILYNENSCRVYNMSGVETVSYTHLDVYKRQEHENDLLAAHGDSL